MYKEPGSCLFIAAMIAALGRVHEARTIYSFGCKYFVLGDTDSAIIMYAKEEEDYYWYSK